VAFTTYVQNVAVEYWPLASRKKCPRPDGILKVQRSLITGFWAALKHRFPAVKKVILNHIGESVSSENDEGPFPMALQLLLQACPHDVECSVLIFKKRKPQYNANTTSLPTIGWKQSLHRQVGVGAWDRNEPDKCRKTILMPPKQFKGPVGRYGKLLYNQYTKNPLHQYSLFPLVVEALDRYHFEMGRNDPFSCPLPSCEAHFDKAGQWTIYVAKAHFREWSSLLETLPSSAGADLRKRS
jgi:hypothetical protein